MRAGEIDIVNQDAVLHDVHACLDPEGRTNTLFNFALPVKGQVAKKRLRAPGIVRFGCGVHPWMRAYVIVRDNPYFALSDRHGRYAISDIPAGRRVVVIWHAVLGLAKKRVEIRAGETTRLDIPRGE